ncbi:MAG TPA: hypothetical protein VLQ79_09920, partial [Myxococcaceae bacterium]|nr:hypothetical protein [Myxococcaceae bacterium]
MSASLRRVPMNVWIVTAEDAPANVIARGLEHAGWACRRFEDAEAADQAARTEPPDAYVVLDPCPPWGVAGLLSRLRESDAEAGRPVLVVGVGDVELRTRLLDLGADDVLPANVAPEELLARLRRRSALFRRATVASTRGAEDRVAVVDA